MKLCSRTIASNGFARQPSSRRRGWVKKPTPMYDRPRLEVLEDRVVPESGHLTVHKIMIGGTDTFAFSLPGTSPATGSISNPAVGIERDVTPGQYIVTENLTLAQVAAGWVLTKIDCSDDPTGNSTTNLGMSQATYNIADGETVRCYFTNTKQGGPGPTPPGADIFPTGTTCNDFKTGSATPLSNATYQLGGNPQTIKNAQPGVFFYYAAIPAQNANFTAKVNQTNDQPAVKLFQVQNISANQVQVLDANCTRDPKQGPITFDATGTQVTINVSGPITSGVIYISIKYDVKSVEGSPKPNPSTVNYTFTTDINMVFLAGSTAGLPLTLGPGGSPPLHDPSDDEDSGVTDPSLVHEIANLGAPLLSTLPNGTSFLVDVGRNGHEDVPALLPPQSPVPLAVNGTHLTPTQPSNRVVLDQLFAAFEDQAQSETFTGGLVLDQPI